LACWPLAFLVSGLVMQLLIGMAVNSSNDAALVTGNATGMTFLWMICVSLWVIFSLQRDIRTLDCLAALRSWYYRNGRHAGRSALGSWQGLSRRTKDSGGSIDKP
jgi:hypothetical protein